MSTTYIRIKRWVVPKVAQPIEVLIQEKTRELEKLQEKANPSYRHLEKNFKRQIA
jgi:hypothetical protein